MAPQFFLDYPSIDFSSAGELTLAGRPVSELVAEFGSPLVVILEDVVRANCRRYRSRFGTYPRSRIYYASKALLTKGLCRLLMQEGLGIDVVSAGELHTALTAGVAPSDIVMHGNAKTAAELHMAVKAGVGRIVVDNFADIERLAALASVGAPINLHLRIAPGIKPDTHKYIQTGQVDSKFGFNLVTEGEESDAFHAAAQIKQHSGLSLVGIHCHIGSQIMDEGSFTAAARVMMQFYSRLKHELELPLDELNIGGGIAIRYQPGDAPPSVEDHLAGLTQELLRLSAELKVEPPVLCDEPGRSIIGEAGVTLYSVQSTKRIPGVRNYAGLDGGMTDNPRYALYQARHYAMRASAAPEARGEVGNEVWSLSGKCCETGDMLIHDTDLPALTAGDIVAMFSTGAYTYSMASNYNRVPRPAVVLAGSSGVSLLARRESPEDTARLDEVPAWLA
ncbi:MAG: diaminopimelate decarboxylase [bacterium]|nr:diaminopimelate decarboxylase [bacterium]